MSSAATRPLIPERRPLSDDVYDALLGLLMDHSIEPGSRLKIDVLAKDLGVSQTPVREALARLEPEGLVTKQAHRGYTATPLLDAEGVGQLYAMREQLEPFSARLAAPRVGPDELAALGALVTAMRKEAAQPSGAGGYPGHRGFVDHDAEFHRFIAEHSGNALLVDAVARLRAHLHLYRLYFDHGIEAETSAEHEQIVAALASGRGAAAEKAMRDHIRQSYRRISARLG
jgi:DNA-binding GntR family transcriptional regulator